MIKRDIHTLAVVLSALCTLSMGCAHKQDGCRLDTECPNGQICRNTKCESTPESALRAAHDDGRGPGDIQAITNADIQNHTKLVDLGPGVDYTLEEKITLSASQKLQIEPGVTILMKSSDAAIETTDDSLLVMEGSSQKPIVLRADPNVKWQGIRLGGTNPNHTLKHVTLENAAAGDAAILLTDEAQASLENLTIQDANDAIKALNTSTIKKLHSTTLNHCQGFPLTLDTLQILKSAQNNHFDGAQKRAIRILHAPILINDTFTVPKFDLPFQFDDGLNVSGLGVFTIPEGTEFTVGKEKIVAFSDVQLNILGRSNAPVLMHGIKDEDGYWAGVTVSSMNATVIQHLTLINTGADMAPALSLNDKSKVTLKNITFSGSAAICLAIGEEVDLTNEGGHSFNGCQNGNVLDERLEDTVHNIIDDIPIG